MPGIWMSSSSTCAPLGGSRSSASSAVARLAHDAGRQLGGDVAEQLLQPLARRLLVVGDEDLELRSCALPHLVGHLDLDAVARRRPRWSSMRASASKNSARRSRMFSSAMRLPARCSSASRYGFSMRASTRSPRRSMRTSTSPGAGARLDAVVHRVLEQRLQHQRRQQRVGRRGVELPGDAQPLAQAQLLDARRSARAARSRRRGARTGARPTSACGTGRPGPRARARRAAGRGG